ncbi:hypothetical protein FHW12_000457 [Dokdonella fugitiva]|uniref:Uncharacterized protein n=1 Tax=Dokdonella fugitiva TaxID=328517 RepID=A0A839EV30_9GAMM|nr:hypothetical protein [Dokdonella fugitiva]MBA8886266.1 hypothetical protein [Dokdonella fugitiva]
MDAGVAGDALPSMKAMDGSFERYEPEVPRKAMCHVGAAIEDDGIKL